MLVAVEPLRTAAARILEKSFGPVTSIRRPPQGSRMNLSLAVD